MSGKLNIAFAADMPAAAVEVIAPDWSTVTRIWLSPGQRQEVDVPSEASFLRVHLASGKTVSLQDPGNLTRLITRADLFGRRDTPRPLAPATDGRLRSVRELQQVSYDEVSHHASLSLAVATEIELDGQVSVRLRAPGDVPVPGNLDDEGVSASFRPGSIEAPYELTLDATDLSVNVRIPGSTEELLVRSDNVGDGGRVISVRVRTISPIADTIAAYMKRGDLHSAETITEWAQQTKGAEQAAQAETLLSEKSRDPFAAAIGAYLLLRLRRFDLMRDWAWNLANWFPNVPDGRVICAWQQIYKRGDEQQIRKWLQEALAGPVPVFTEGMRLLRDGAYTMGPEAVAGLEARGGVVLWSSPFTAMVSSTRKTTTPPLSVNIDYYAPSA